MVMKCDKMFATFRWWSTKTNSEISQQTIQWSDKTHNIWKIIFTRLQFGLCIDLLIYWEIHRYVWFLIYFFKFSFDFFVFSYTSLSIPHASMSIFILILLTFCIFQSLHFFRSKYWTIEVEINPKQTLFDSIAAIYANIITAEISKHVCLMPLSPLVPSRIQTFYQFIFRLIFGLCIDLWRNRCLDETRYSR